MPCRRQVTVGEIVEELSGSKSAWHRLDVLRTVCDQVRPNRASTVNGGWDCSTERSTRCSSSASTSTRPRPARHERVSDGRSMWIEPVASHVTSEAGPRPRGAILTWALDAQTADPPPSPTVDRGGLDVLQADAAAAVAGDDRLVLMSDRPVPARPPCCAPRSPITMSSTARCSVSPRPPKPHGSSNARPGCSLTRSPNCSTNGPAPTAPTVVAPAGTTIVVDEAGMVHRRSRSPGHPRRTTGLAARAGR